MLASYPINHNGLVETKQLFLCNYFFAIIQSNKENCNPFVSRCLIVQIGYENKILLAL